MGKVSGFLKGTVKSVVDVGGWIGYEQLKENSKDLVTNIVPTFKIEKPTHEENFDQAMARQGLSEEDVQRMQKRYQHQTLVYIAIAVLIILYMFYLLWHGHFITSFIALLAAVWAVLRACIANFYVFQIKNRKLGCTIKEWLNGKVKEQH